MRAHALAIDVVASAPVWMISFSALPNGPHQLLKVGPWGRGRPAAAAAAKPWVIGSLIVTVELAGMWPASSVMTCWDSGETSASARLTASSAWSASRFGLMYQPSVPVNGLASPPGPLGIGT